ncbi:MAG: helix-turn-helix domain-containing protein [Roseibium album]|uniref:winged helix-turn-helix domain-containing protein n=1 Tax=Stappiaceae TaxID=2821832 RepID=UPI00048C52AA|nr:MULTISPECIES: helix-turn-helix domain-containing protein [Stappiaceae]MBG6147560.1 DNA-binding response OmpR family regulator [Labrenzia sp. EL_142]MBG6155604.1 DNA-binding response OmpR family regulator [Labrenzia sp. EL_162]MBG6161059.1 DNA-binding response OmpR family regulator [Labrenzia sp. EL_195]MBG6177370.1 DNA-binding response OmpR family regulator [Labrenzia sp. EL_132]MBG6194138.1 DNA-binding response OmpR family regulator [Labrenzia sp. EL_159]MBG6200887.1 DNA-binding response 
MSLALDYEIVHLREQLERKEARIAELERLIADQQVIFPPEWDLTRIQTRILRFLLKRTFANREQIHAFLYADREDGGPELENVRVHICLLRKKLKPRGVNISWLVGMGYRLDDDTKEKIRTTSLLPA